MAGNIAHMLICKVALEKVAKKNADYNDFITKIFSNNLANKEHLVWANLGSMAPDLFYYSAPARALWQFYVDKYLKSEMMEPWSYHMHSVRPNVMPLKLLEITFRDANKNANNYVLEDIDFKKIAFIIGYLTHIAVDQVTHQTANIMAGPYYRSGPNRKLHRELEIQMDYHLYESLNHNHPDHVPFEKQDFSRWAFYVDPSPNAIATSVINYLMRHPAIFFSNLLFRPVSGIDFCIRISAHHVSEEWFTPFFQRGFVETHGSFPPEKNIVFSYFTLGILLSTTRKAKPYKKAKDKYNKKYQDNPKYEEYFLGNGIRNDYEKAVEKASKYISAFLEIYSILLHNKKLLPNDVDRFLTTVEGNDLSSPCLE